MRHGLPSFSNNFCGGLNGIYSQGVSFFEGVSILHEIRQFLDPCLKALLSLELARSHGNIVGMRIDRDSFLYSEVRW